MNQRIGIDVAGTNTDAVLVDEDSVTKLLHAISLKTKQKNLLYLY